MFAVVEGMAPAALDGVAFEFETFASSSRARGTARRELACYVGHSTLRRAVMGADATKREATAAEIDAMRRRRARGDGRGRGGLLVVALADPGRRRGIADREPVRVARRAARAGRGDGPRGGGSISYLPKSVVGGLDAADEALLIELGVASRLPIVIQGLGGRDKVDVPRRGLGPRRSSSSTRRRGAAPRSSRCCAITRSTARSISRRARRCTRACPRGTRAWRSRATRSSRACAIPTSAPGCATRSSIPIAIADAGSTLPPPRWEVVFVDEVADPRHARSCGRTIAEIAAEQGVAPADAMLDLALAEELATRFRFENRTPAWEQAVRESMKHPSILIGVSDGGAHLDRDDGAEWSSHFLRFWVLDRGEWTLEEGIRQLTQVPAALAGFADRGALLPGLPRDLFVFDPATIGPGTSGA
jgi:hypothetical protein